MMSDLPEPLEGSTFTITSLDECRQFIETWMAICSNAIAFHVGQQGSKQKVGVGAAAPEKGLLQKLQLENRKLLDMETELVGLLQSVNPEVRAEYIRLRDDFTDDVIFTNEFKKPPHINKPQPLDSACAKLLQTLAAVPELSAWLQKYEQLLVEFNLVASCQRSAGSGLRVFGARHDRIACYILYGIQDFLGHVRARIESGSAHAGTRNNVLFQIIQSLSIFRRQRVDKLLDDVLGQPLLGMEGSKADYLRRQEDLSAANDDLNAHARRFNADADDPVKDEYYKQYNQLVMRRDIMTKLVADERKQLGYIDAATLALRPSEIKDRGQKSAEQFGKAFAVKAGSSLAIAIYKAASGGDNDWGSVLKDMGKDLLDLAALSVAGALFGPVGSGIAGNLMQFIWRKPDPCMEALAEIKGSLKEIIGKIDEVDAKLLGIDKKLVGLDDKIDERFRELTNALLKLTPLQAKRTVWEMEVSRLIHKLKDMESYGSDLRHGRPIKHDECIWLARDIIESMTRLISVFCAPNYNMVTAMAGDDPDGFLLTLDKNSIAGVVVDIFSANGESLKKPFDEAVDFLLPFCDFIRDVARIFHGRHPLFIESLSAAMVFKEIEGATSGNRIVWDIIHDQVMQADALSGELFATAFRIDALVFGHGVLKLHKDMKACRSDPANLNFLRGFGLLNNRSDFGPGTDDKQYAVDFRRVKKDSDGKWKEATDDWSTGMVRVDFEHPVKAINAVAASGHSRLRYFLLPGLLEKEPDVFGLVTFQGNDIPLPIPVRVSLVGVGRLAFTPCNPGEFIPFTAYPVELQHSYFSGSLEKLILDGGVIDFPMDYRSNDLENQRTVLDKFSTPDPACRMDIEVAITLSQIELRLMSRRSGGGKESEVCIACYKGNHPGNLTGVPSMASGKFRLHAFVDQGKIIFTVKSLLLVNQSGFTRHGQSEILLATLSLVDAGDKGRALLSKFYRDLQGDGGSSVGGMRLRPFNNLIPPGVKLEFSDKGLPDVRKELLVCESDNQKHRILLVRRYLYYPQMILRSGGQEKSLFSDYELRNVYAFTLEMQPHDGHLVLYDKPEKGDARAVAATGVWCGSSPSDAKKKLYGNSYVYLSDSGDIFQLSQARSIIDVIRPRDCGYTVIKDNNGQHKTNVMKPDYQLKSGERIVSANGRYEFAFSSQHIWLGQKVFVLREGIAELSCYLRNRNSDEAVKPSKDSHAHMQNDGNLVAYAREDGIFSNPIIAIYASHTNGNDGSYLVLKDNGDVVLYTKDDKVLKVLKP